MDINPKPRKGYCACGKELHYTTPKMRKIMDEIVKKNGEYIKVNIEEYPHIYDVPRHYIALHGLVAKDLPNLGFTRRKKKSKKVLT